MPGPIPAPLPPWAKALLWVAPAIPSFLQDLVDYIGEMQDATQPTGHSWRRCQLVFTDAGNQDSADRMTTTLDIANITGGQLDDSWTAADYTTVDTQVKAIVTAWMSIAQGRLRNTERRYYRMSFNPMSDPHPFAISGPPEKIILDTAAGQAPVAGNQANQVAMSVTERTPYPHHWGRAYWPLPSAAQLDTAGRFTTSSITNFGNSMQAAFLALQTAEFFPVVPVTQVLKAPSRNLLTITKLQIDNVPDVIRRRRIRNKTVAWTSTP